jgi:hypothetical protein
MNFVDLSPPAIKKKAGEKPGKKMNLLRTCSPMKSIRCDNTCTEQIPRRVPFAPPPRKLSTVLFLLSLLAPPDHCYPNFSSQEREPPRSRCPVVDSSLNRGPVRVRPLDSCH